MASCSTLRDEPIGPSAMHVCVDMQRMFGEGTPWALPWMPRVLPNIAALCEAHARDTVFTRFIPARRLGEGHGTWRRYYRRWEMMTIERIGAAMVDLTPELARFVPPAHVVDKPVYSPWLGSNLRALLEARDCDTLIVTGGETDMCHHPRRRRLRLPDHRRAGCAVQRFGRRTRRHAGAFQQSLRPACRNRESRWRITRLGERLVPLFSD